MIRTPPKTIFYLLSLPLIFSNLGQRILIDFGLAGLFDRFERTLGKPVTGILTALIGMAVAVVCAGLIVQGLTPAYKFIKSAMFEAGSRQTLLDGVAIGVIFMATITAAVLFSWLSEVSRSARRTLQSHSELQDAIKSLEARERKITETADEVEKREARSRERMLELKNDTEKLEEEYNNLLLEVEALRVEKQLPQPHPKTE